MLDFNDIDSGDRGGFIFLKSKMDEAIRQLGDSRNKPLEEMSEEELELKMTATFMEYLCCGLSFPLWEASLDPTIESIRLLQDCIEKNKSLEELHPEIFPDHDARVLY